MAAATGAPPTPTPAFFQRKPALTFLIADLYSLFCAFSSHVAVAAAARGADTHRTLFFSAGLLRQMSHSPVPIKNTLTGGHHQHSHTHTHTEQNARAIFYYLTTLFFVGLVVIALFFWYVATLNLCSFVYLFSGDVLVLLSATKTHARTHTMMVLSSSSSSVVVAVARRGGRSDDDDATTATLR